MRVRLPLGRSLFFLCAMLFALVALLPLQLAISWLSLDERGLAAREAQGSIWLGALSEARFGPFALGDLRVSLRSLPLLAGRARLDVTRENPGFDGSITVSRHGFAVDDLSGTITVAGAIPLLSSIEASEFTAHFADGQCERAEGAVKANLAGAVGGLSLPAGLTGSARCEGGQLLLPLAGQSAMERLEVRIGGDGRYTAALTIQPSDDMMRNRLAAAGFAATGAGYTLSLSDSIAR